MSSLTESGNTQPLYPGTETPYHGQASTTSPVANINNNNTNNNNNSNQHQSSNKSWRPTALADAGTQQYPSKSVETGVNIDHERERLISAWNLLSEKGDLRIKSLESVRHGRIPTYETDFVSSGYLSLENAQMRLDLYKQMIYPTYPLISIGDVSLEEMRRQTPTLFSCIMAVTSMALKSSLIQQTGPQMSANTNSSASSSPISPLARENGEFCACLNLYNMAYEAVVFQTMLVGVMSLEMLKCVIVLTYWYNEPEFYHRHKSHLLANLAVSMASDLGIGGNSPLSKNVALRFEKVVSPHTTPANGNGSLTPAETQEFRQLWLACYCSSMNLLNVSRNPLGHAGSIWTAYSDKCCASLLQEAGLSSSPSARIVQFAQLAHIFEDISRAFYARDKLPPDISSGETKYFLDYFERRLNSVQESARALDFRSSTVFEPYFHAVNTYLHQFVLYVPFSEELGRSPFTEFSLAVNVDKFSADAVRCIIACHFSVSQSLNLFSRLTVEQFAYLPLFSHTRLVFCVSVLLKLLALSFCNPAMTEACPLDVSSLEPIYLIIYKMRQVYENYPFSNSAICFSFVIRLLLCHFDGQVQYFTAKRNGLIYPNQTGVIQQGDVDQNHNQQQQQQQQQSSLPLHQQQQQQPQNVQNMAGMQGNIADPSSFMSYQGGGPGVPGSQMDEEYPAWVINDEFWRDLLPNVEAFSGYEI